MNRHGFKEGDNVITPHGSGKIVAFEDFKGGERIGVELENNPFSFPVAYYFLHEIKTMKYIEFAIKVVINPDSDAHSVEIEREVLRKYYAENKEAHREYIDKGIYEMLPEMAGFRAEMEQIEKILSEQMQMKLF